MAHRLTFLVALLALAACGGSGVDGEWPRAPEPPEGVRTSLGESCPFTETCGCYEFCDAGSCASGPYRGDFSQCGSAMSQCLLGHCCQDPDACPDDGRACTLATCDGDPTYGSPPATCLQVVYCPPRSACDSASGVCGDGSGGPGDVCDYTGQYAGDGASCGTSLWCFAGLCRPGCYIGGLYFDDAAVNPGNGCERCDPAASRTAWSAIADGTSCGTGKVCQAATCRDGCLVGGTLYALGDRNPGNECQACAAASPNAWTNTTDPCTDDGDPCTVDHCAGDGTCGHYPEPSACAGPMTDSMFGCSSGSGAGLLSLLLVGALAWRPRRSRGLLVAALLAGPVLARAAPPAPAASPPTPRRPVDEIAIFTFKAGPEVSEQTAALVTQAFGAALHERGIPTLSQEDVKAALGFEKQRQMLGCDTEGCFAEIGGALGVRLMVSGSLGRVGDSLVLNAQLVDARNASVERRHTARRPGSRGDAAYLEAVPELVEALFPLGPEAGMERRLAIAAGGWLELHGDPGGAGLLLARWSFRPWLRAAAGVLVAPERVGATARLDWLPWRPERRVHPVASLELMALSADPLSPGVGLSVGAEWRVTPRFDLALEVPVVRLFAVLDGMRETYVFAALTAAWRL